MLNFACPVKSFKILTGVQVKASGPWGLRPGGEGDPAIAGLTTQVRSVGPTPVPSSGATWHGGAGPSTICRSYGAGTNTLSILRIKLKLHFVQNLSLTSRQWREAKEGVLQRSHFYIWHNYSVYYLTGSMLALMEEYEFSVI